jgi:phage baseplate assembly protein W
MITPNIPEINIAAGVEYTSYPTRTFFIDRDRCVRMTDGAEAMRQAIEIILSTERFAWRIYSPNFGVELRRLIGMDYELAAALLKRSLREALLTDDRVTAVDGFRFVQGDGSLTAEFTVHTIYGEVEKSLGVVI